MRTFQAPWDEAVARVSERPVDGARVLSVTTPRGGFSVQLSAPRVLADVLDEPPSRTPTAWLN
ncbi:MAG: hypothetical protein FJX76_15760 [Armatimonadetes bacterium]|nr:hypothetical protein [Armatimonadota bacterium]